MRGLVERGVAASQRFRRPATAGSGEAVFQRGATAFECRMTAFASGATAFVSGAREQLLWRVEQLIWRVEQLREGRSNCESSLGPPLRDWLSPPAEGAHLLITGN